jgi:protein ImuB
MSTTITSRTPHATSATHATGAVHATGATRATPRDVPTDGSSRAPARTAALWVPDWPVLAAMTCDDIPGHVPAAVHDGRRVVAVSAVARAAGVRRGMRRRHAQETCPELVLLQADAGRDARGFEPVAAAAETVVSGIEIARPGLVLIPSRGAGRYHGSEQALAAELVSQVAVLAGYEAQVGIADGAGAAVLAARASVIVPEGGTTAFLAPLGIGELVHVAAQDVERVADLVDLLGRLGLRTLGDLAALPRTDLLARFGRQGGWAHDVAAGADDRPTALRRLEPDVAVETELDPPV